MKTSGVANAYITFKNYEGKTPIIDGSGQGAPSDDLANALIFINDKSYIKVICFEVTNNNIGIDFIGYEGTASSNDYVCNGKCSGNQVWNISSINNKTYTNVC